MLRQYSQTIEILEPENTILNSARKLIVMSVGVPSDYVGRII